VARRLHRPAWLRPQAKSVQGWPIQIEFPVHPRSRYGWGKPAHEGLRKILSAGDERYAEQLRSILELQDALAAMPVAGAGPDVRTSWRNDYFYGLDTAALFWMIASKRPQQFLEIGSGYSTQIARRAISDGGLATRLRSIDPNPRLGIDELCDEVFRFGLEDADLSIFDSLEAGDILFMDGTHYSFMNSDTTVFFLEVLPRLKPGVIVHLHDVFLPWDYRPDWDGRYYTEQYIVAAQLLSGASTFEVILPAFYVSTEPHLAGILTPLWERLGLTGIYERVGQSFWMRTVAA
jgi:hypothetical protein